MSQTFLLQIKLGTNFFQFALYGFEKCYGSSKVVRLFEESKKLAYISLHKKRSFSLRIFSVNVTKSEVYCRFGYNCRRNPQWKTSFFLQCMEINFPISFETADKLKNQSKKR